MISIRAETPKDCNAIRSVVVDAFAASQFGHDGEADLVEQLREQCGRNRGEEYLSLVAVDGDEVVGHILFTPVSLAVGTETIRGMGLAPMAVAPNRQKTGVGIALVNAGLKQLSENGCPYVVVLGHPQYYPRFGFEPATKYGVLHRFAGCPQDVFFIKWLDRKMQQAVQGGEVTYHQVFGPQHKDIDE